MPDCLSGHEAEPVDGDGGSGARGHQKIGALKQSVKKEFLVLYSRIYYAGIRIGNIRVQ